MLGINIAAVYLGLSLGPVLGGILTHHLGWRTIFFLATFLGCAVVGVLFAKVKGEWTGAKGEKFDFVGSIVYVLGLVALVYGFTLLQQSSEMGLGVGLIMGGVLGLSLFVTWEGVQCSRCGLDLGGHACHASWFLTTGRQAFG